MTIQIYKPDVNGAWKSPEGAGYVCKDIADSEPVPKGWTSDWDKLFRALTKQPAADSSAAPAEPEASDAPAA